jgi:hypothetical protein
LSTSGKNNPTLAEDAKVGLPAKGWRTWQVGAYPHFRRRLVGKQGVAVGRRLFLLPSFISIVSGHAKTFHVAIVNLSLRDDSMKKDAAYWIEKLCLERHPEGGYYRQSYKAALILAKESLPPEFTGARAASTAIYFLLEFLSLSSAALRRSLAFLCWINTGCACD